MGFRMHVSGCAAFPGGKAARKGLGGVVLPDGSVPKRPGGSLRPQGAKAGGREGTRRRPVGPEGVIEHDDWVRAARRAGTGEHCRYGMSVDFFRDGKQR